MGSDRPGKGSASRLNLRYGIFASSRALQIKSQSFESAPVQSCSAKSGFTGSFGGEDASSRRSTSGTPQSEHSVKPKRYSDLQTGQNMLQTFYRKGARCASVSWRQERARSNRGGEFFILRLARGLCPFCLTTLILRNATPVHKLNLAFPGAEWRIIKRSTRPPQVPARRIQCTASP